MRIRARRCDAVNHEAQPRLVFKVRPERLPQYRHSQAKKQVERCAGKSRDEKWGLVFAWLLGKTWNVGTAAFLQYKTHHDNTNDDAFLQHTIMGTSPGAAKRAEAAATANVVQRATGNTAGISHYGGGSPALPMLADGRVSESSGAASPQTEIVTVVAQKDMLLYMTGSMCYV